MGERKGRKRRKDKKAEGVGGNEERGRKVLMRGVIKKREVRR